MIVKIILAYVRIKDFFLYQIIYCLYTFISTKAQVKNTFFPLLSIQKLFFLLIFKSYK